MAKTIYNTVIVEPAPDKESREYRTLIEITNHGPSNELRCHIMGGAEYAEDEMIEIFRPACENRIILSKNVLYDIVKVLQAEERATKKK